MLQFPCGQCVPCRIRRKSGWILRNLLESRLAVSSSFWTLTFSDKGLQTLEDRGPKKIIYSFLDALRKSECRGGNSAPIRSYGCYELGGMLGRPHYHMLLYNVVVNYQEPTNYTKGLPRPRYHIGCWPHGHVDIGQHNPATVNYTIEYLMKDTRKDGNQSFPIRTQRPAIGFYGLQSLAVSLANKHGELPEMPTSLMLNGRSYPLDHWSKNVLREEFKEAGGTFKNWPGPLDKKLRFLQTCAEFDAFPHIKARFEKRNEQTERLIAQAEAKKNARIETIHNRAAGIAARSSPLRSHEDETQSD